MYIVKFTPYRKNLGEIMLRQTDSWQGFSSDKRYKFVIDDKLESADFWVVQGKGVRQTTSCKVPPQHTLLLTTEPQSVLRYPQKYINQFAAVCSCQECMKHKNKIMSQAILPWFVGYKEDSNGKCAATLDFDQLKKMESPKKTKLISVITSNKAFTQGHLNRIAFVEKLKQHYGNKLDVFGSGFNSFDDKWDVLAPYKYHIVIENSSQPYYWTEKISDCFMAETFPFYYGCTNLNEYFPQQAYTPIDICNADKAIEIIDKAISEDLYEKQKNNLYLCKQKVLDEYNMFNFIAHLCDTLNPNDKRENVTIEPCKSMQDWHNFYNYFISRNIFKTKQKIKNLFHKSTLGKR